MYPFWEQKGIYIAFSSSLESPETDWYSPRLLYDPPDPQGDDPPFHYPQVIGPGANDTDLIAGQTCRFFLTGESEHILWFWSGAKLRLAARRAGGGRIPPGGLRYCERGRWVQLGGARISLKRVTIRSISA